MAADLLDPQVPSAAAAADLHDLAEVATRSLLPATFDVVGGKRTKGQEKADLRSRQAPSPQRDACP